MLASLESFAMAKGLAMNQSEDLGEQDGFQALVPDAVRNAFHQAFGEAMASFGGIEAALMYVFTSLLQPANATRGHDVFRSGIGFKGQLDMISALVVSTDVDGELQQEWKQLRNRIETVQSRRNKLAHMHVWQMSGHGLFGYDTKKKIEDLPVDWSRRQHHQSVFTTEKMRTYRLEFDEVARLIVDFDEKANSYVRGSALVRAK
ncbi:hypothetical protein [Rhizobium leguminosarum]|nr:hypothetical protein [Rhizobium leguminosarum]